VVALSAGILVGTLIVLLQIRQAVSRVRDLRGRYQYSPTSEGSLFCNYVDVAVLQRLATDLGIEPNPTQVEEHRAKRFSRGLGLRLGRGEVRAGREDESGRKETYALPFDPERLTAGVIDRLRETDRVDLGLGFAPSGAAAQWHTLLELLGGEGDGESDRGLPPDLKRRVGDLVNKALAGEKADHFRRVAEERPYALVEGLWRVGNALGDKRGIILELAELHSYPRDKLPMPATLTLQVPIEFDSVGFSGGAGFTPRGAQRIKSAESVVCGVLGTPESFQSGLLRMTPVVVFDRVGGRPFEPYGPSEFLGT